ncbi:ThiF family adenylyltransferase [Cohnella nanjingensis]|uniref:ThiF family adenylyltransferase n=1 Tax=Cohnella nanjingensis TaxID=1387779 RepID=A0A7X0RP89_9BACL|nr:ThiF family adenylyltransferase [Cohnella nanjingensis]MBB6669724.1 ThiF family adenylyltransferase [Cohnella nanjingensis]
MSKLAGDRERYARQMRFAPIGAAGQDRLKDARVLIVGVGALGSSLAEQMARAGAGEIRIVDRDFVEPSNLQRQSLFDEEDAREALPKAVAAAAKLRRINGGIRVTPEVADVTPRNADALLAGMDLALDGTDNAACRLAVSDACFRRGVPLIYGGVTGSAGSSAALVPGETACFRCLLGGEETAESDRNCETAGVIYPAVAFVAALQAAEALKWLTGNRDALRRSWLNADVWRFAVRESRMPAGQDGCPYCGAREAERRALERSLPLSAASGPDSGETRFRGSGADEGGGEAEGRLPMEATVLCGRETVQVATGLARSPREQEGILRASGCRVTAVNAFLARAVTPGGIRLTAFADGRVLVQGEADAQVAIGLCRRYLIGSADPERTDGRGTDRRISREEEGRDSHANDS